MIKGAEPIFINHHSKVGILMLHGFTSSPHEFRELSEFLSRRGFTVYAPLIAGHGTQPEDLLKTNPEDWLASAREAYVKLKNNCQQVFIIGNSFGSNLAFWLIKEFNNEAIGVITLDAPIFLRNHFIIWLRLNSYGIFKKYYRKSPRMYRADYIDGVDTVSYPIIPIKSLRDFLRFIKKETAPNLDKVRIPALITHARIDPVVNPKSATYIYDRLGSGYKKKHWFLNNHHSVTVEGRRKEVFSRILDFIEEVIKIDLNNKMLPTLFFETARSYPHKAALLYKKEGVYFPVTYRELSKKIIIFAAGLQSMGIKKGDKVVILSENRPEWVIADMAIMVIGGVVAPIHTTFSPEAILKILNHCRAKIIIVSDSTMLGKILLNFKKLKYLEKIIFLNKLTHLQKENLKDKIISLRKILSLSANKTYQYVPLDPTDCCSIIYTSGTTGDPKGVMLTHRNFLSNMESLQKTVPVKKSDVFLSFLPLSHVLERTVGYYMPIFFGATIAYAEHIKELSNNLKEVAPTILISVPRVFEKFHDAVWDTVNAMSPARKKFFHWALSLKKGTLLHWLIDAAVFKKIRRKMGKNLRLTISGGASLNKNICEFFSKIGITILEGYGLTETSPVVACNDEKNIKFGTVGRVIPGVQVKLSKEKEVLVKGPNVFGGYFKNKKETALGFTQDGWFCTGDLGSIDEDGFLTIIGRKKELIVLSVGKKVWPEPVENLLNNDKYISQSIVLGNDQKFISALVVPSWQKIELFLKKNNVPLQSQEQLIRHPMILSLFQQHLDEKINPQLSDEAKIKKFTLLFHEFSQGRGELTPTLKLRRRVIETHYKKLIAAMYD